MYIIQYIYTHILILNESIKSINIQKNSPISTVKERKKLLSSGSVSFAVSCDLLSLSSSSTSHSAVAHGSKYNGKGLPGVTC